MTRRQAFAQFLARYVRAFAQWLDPLPDAVSGLHAVIAQNRADLASLVEDLARANDVHFIEMANVSTQLATATDQLVALQRAHAHCLPVPQDELAASARQMTQELADREASGAWKRGQVDARLKDAFPHRSGRERALAIEAALWP